MSSPVAVVLADLAGALEGIGAGWYLFGAQAALLRGSRRLTADVDVTLLPSSHDTSALVERLERRGFALRVKADEPFLEATRVLPITHVATNMPVDVVLGGPGLEELFLESSETLEIEGVRIRVPTAEHLVVMKLLAGREKDLDDAAAIGRARELDHAAIGELVESIAVGLGEDEIRRALAELRTRLS